MPLVLKDPVERLIGQYLVDMVDDAGYLPGADLSSIAEKLGAPLEVVEKVLAALQTLDPPGVFARSLAECLALQLKEQNRYDPIISRFLENLHLLAGHNFPALRKAVGCEMDELLEIIAEIKKLNPKPGLKFGTVQLQPVVPDVLVRGAPDGSWIIELNADTLPRVLVNRTYLTTVSKSTGSAADRNYLLECLQTANWLVKSLDQRARTIMRVAEEIVRQQDGFFTHGVQYLRPLNLRTVADAISMHESTVSRVTSNKYMATPRGIFELKYFFTSAINSSDDDAESHSSEAVRHRIRQMIDGESPASVLSDDKIVEKLKMRRHRYCPPDGRQIPRGDAHPLIGAAPARQAAARARRARLRLTRWRALVPPLLLLYRHPGVRPDPRRRRVGGLAILDQRRAMALFLHRIAWGYPWVNRRSEGIFDETRGRRPLGSLKLSLRDPHVS